ncbi:MAG: dihydrolipoyllysine-residue acetyltransferase [Candidatus Parcubacteria bacterium]|nr:dihydrolipoyllysine-residue acetyltransferase [Burkholderiales bacterium]
MRHRSQQAGPDHRMKDVLVPDIGDFKEVEVVEILVKAGDTVTKEQSLVSLESDKATMEIPSPQAGVVKELKVKVGDKVSEGSVLLAMEAGAAEPAAAAARSPEAQAPAAKAPDAKASESKTAVAPSVVTRVEPVPIEPKDALTALPHASPAIRKFARELGVDLTLVQGSGPKGRIAREDVQSFVKGALAGKTASAVATAGKGGGLDLLPWPEVDFGKFGPIELKARSRIKKLSAANLHRNWVMIPHVTQFDEADITELETFRKSNTAETEKQGFKLTMLAFLIKASVTALRQFPDFNSSIDKSGDNLVLKKYFHIGVAVDTPDGLMVPVVRDADRKGVFDLARELSEISKRARDKKLKAGDMQGGTFSISSLGGIGGTSFTPIINAPEVAILGVSRSYLKPIFSGKSDKGEDIFKARLILPLSLSYDHRVIDGALAARFTAYLATVLSDIRRTLL